MVDVCLQPTRSHGLGRWRPDGPWCDRFRRWNTSSYKLGSDCDCNVRLPVVSTFSFSKIINPDPSTPCNSSTSKLVVPASRHDQHLGLLACFRCWDDTGLQLQVSHGFMRHQSLRRKWSSDLDAVYLCRGWTLESRFMLYGCHLRPHHDHTVSRLHRHAYGILFRYTRSTFLPSSTSDQIYRICQALAMGRPWGYLSRRRRWLATMA
jgi:hypothetical protein